MNYYNEHDKDMAEWLRELIARGEIPAGHVDERSITNVKAHELNGYTQCHFFAGVGGWPLALKLAGWPATRPIWTGSCPCQPFSAAGAGKGQSDERHLWPVFFGLIRECGPGLVFGEQVASSLVVGKVGGDHPEADGPVWLDGVCADLEAAGYATGAIVLGAHSAGAPHIRQRLYWLADADHIRFERLPKGAGCDVEGESRTRNSGEKRRTSGQFAGDCATGGLADGTGTRCNRSEQNPKSDSRDEARLCVSGADGGTGGLADGECARLEGHAGHGDGGDESGRINAIEARPTAASGGAVPGITGQSPGNTCRLADVHGNGCDQARGSEPAPGHDGTFGDGGWSDSRWLLCRDGKHRRIPTQPALYPLADGLSYKLARRGSIRPALLKGAGNAIVPQVAALFISAYLEGEREGVTAKVIK